MEDDQHRDPLISLISSIGTAAQVFMIILYLDPRPVGEGYISQALGIAPETARTHLRKLSKLNLVARSGRYSGYRSIWRGAQLVLPANNSNLTEGNAEIPRSITDITRSNNIDSTGTSDLGDDPNGNAEILQTSTEILQSSAENLRSSVTTTTAELILNTKNLKEVVVNNDSQKEILSTLYKYRIGKNKAEELSKIPHITPALIEETVRKLRARGRFSTPLLIHCLEDDPPPSHEAYYQPNHPDINNITESEASLTDIEVLNAESEEEELESINNPIWEKLIDTLSINQQLSKTFKQHLDRCIDLIVSDESVTLVVDDHYSYQWLDSNAKKIIGNALVGILGRRVAVTFDEFVDGS